jgi:hypothetical protein
MLARLAAFQYAHGRRLVFAAIVAGAIAGAVRLRGRQAHEPVRGANWWAPRPLRRVYRRFGWRDHANPLPSTQ